MPDRKNRTEEKPTKQEYEVTKFLRFNVPTKKGSFHGMEVHCFYASAVVDALLDSEWSSSKDDSGPLFVSRDSCVEFCNKLMEKHMFHRATQGKRKKGKEKGDRPKKKAGEEDAAEKDEGGIGDGVRERKKKKDKKEKTEETDPEKETVAGESEEVKEGKETEGKEEKIEEKTGEKKDEEKKEQKKKKREKAATRDEGKKKKEKPLTLFMSNDQRFLDGEENIYVWIYDPASTKTLVIGSLMVFGCIAACLFPLWPEWLHGVVYYCSLTGFIVVSSILIMVLIRFVLFCAIWLLTLGRHHVWILPSLTEDVGFFQSFLPLYKHDVVLGQSSTSPSSSSGKEKSGKTSKGKNKTSDNKDSDDCEQEFEMVGRRDVDEDEEKERREGEESGEEREEEEEDYGEEEEDGADDGLEEECEEEEEEKEGDEELKKDK